MNPKHLDLINLAIYKKLVKVHKYFILSNRKANLLLLVPPNTDHSPEKYKRKYKMINNEIIIKLIFNFINKIYNAQSCFTLKICISF